MFNAQDTFQSGRHFNQREFSFPSAVSYIWPYVSALGPPSPQIRVYVTQDTADIIDDRYDID